jgi:hypothetical protein
MAATCWACNADVEDALTCGYCGVLLVPLDPTVLPRGVGDFAGLAQRWGILDDCYREDAIDAAPPPELANLVSALEGADAAALYDWLANAATSAESRTTEYSAMTCLTMAYDSARSRLQQEQSRS